MPNPRAQKPLSYDQIVKDAKSLGVPAQALLDALAGGVKGSVSATVGAPADIYNLINQASFRGQLPNIPLGSEDIAKMLPDVVPTQDKSRQHTAEFGELAGSFIPTPMAGQALKGAVKLGKVGAKALGEELGRRAVMGESFTPFVNTSIPQTNVIKNKGGNWFKGEVEKPLSPLLAKGTINNKEIPYGADFDVAIRKRIEDLKQAASQPNYVGGANRVVQHLEEELKNPRTNEVALNKWIQNNLTNYIKKDMATPEDPVRLMIDNRINQINDKYNKDIARADKLAQKAIDEVDPRKQANLQREADRLRLEAQSERDLSTKHVAHIPLHEELDNFDEMRTREGFPIEGIGKSLQAKNWENFSDSSIYPKKASELQGLNEKLAKIKEIDAEIAQAEIALDEKVLKNFKERGANLSEEEQKNILRGLSFVDKEQFVGDNTLSKAYENLHKLKSFDDDYNLKRLEQNPDINKIAPEASIYSAQTGNLGFSHILDVLKEDLASGRLKPEDLKNISMEQAVRKTADYDLALAKKMQEAQAKKLEDMTVHKEYPEGMRWVQLDKPGQFAAESEAMGHSVRGYEPPEGHPDWIEESGDSGSLGYGHGGWEAIKSGKAKVFSLVDPKGNPHTTVEIKASPTLTPEKREAQMGFLVQRLLGEGMSEERAIEQANKLYPISETNPSITQIKGKGNRKPVETYLPYIQDFVKSGNWSDVGDLKNTGLTKFKNQYLTSEELKPKTQEALNYLNTHPAFEPHRQANKEYLDALDKEFSTNEPVYTRHEMNELERRSVQLLHPEVRYTLNEMKAGLSNPEEYDVDSLGRRLTDIEKLREIHGDVPPVEGMKKGGAVTISNNPDTMYMEIMDKKMAGGGAVAKLARALAKKPEEIRAIAERMAPQVMGEVSGVAGKSKKQFLHEKSLPIDIRVDKPMPDPEIVDLAKHKGKVMIGIKGDPTVTNQTLHKVGDIELESPSPQHGGPMYGHGKDVFWASGLGPAQGVQNLAKEASQAYNAPVLGNYVMMGPDSYYYAQHLADANLNAIAKSGMTEEQIEKLNELIRKGGPLSKGPRPNFETVSDVGNAYMQMQMDPKLRKHFNELMMKPTLSEEIGIPKGQDIAYAITEPSLRNLERGVTGKSIGEMRPDQPLDYSSHPTYSHDIPGSFLGTSPYPVPYELSFPDTVQAVRSVPKQAKQEFGSFGMVGPRQIIDQQLIDELGEYQRQMKALTGKKKGGAIKKAKGGEISEDDIQMEVRPL